MQKTNVIYVDALFLITLLLLESRDNKFSDEF